MPHRMIGLAVALLVACGSNAVAGTSAKPRPVTEGNAEDALHFGYTLDDEEYLHALDTEVGQAQAEVAGLQGEHASPGAIAAAEGRAEAALMTYELEQQGRPLLLEDCLGLGNASRLNGQPAFVRFRCRMTIIGHSHLTITKNEVFTSGDIRQLQAVPRPRHLHPRWSERLMEDRLVQYGRLADPLDPSRQNKITAALCHGSGPGELVNGRSAFVSFRCRVSSRTGGTLNRAFMVVEVVRASKFRVRGTQQLAPL